MLFALVAVLGIAAYFDFKDKKIPDVVSASGWFLLVLQWYFFADSAPLLIAGAAFAVLFLVNSIAARVKENLLAWGDVLLAPVYASICAFRPGEVPIVLLFPLLLLLLYYLHSWDKKVALAPFLFLSALILSVA